MFHSLAMYYTKIARRLTNKDDWAIEVATDHLQSAKSPNHNFVFDILKCLLYCTFRTHHKNK